MLFPTGKRLGATTHGARHHHLARKQVPRLRTLGPLMFKNIFENRVMKNKLQKCFRDNFCAFKYFLLNPKAREALAPRRSNAPSTVQIRQELAKLS